jgi:hypothetical protein
VFPRPFDYTGRTRKHIPDGVFSCSTCVLSFLSCSNATRLRPMHGNTINAKMWSSAPPTSNVCVLFFQSHRSNFYSAVTTSLWLSTFKNTPSSMTSSPFRFLAESHWPQPCCPHV